MVPLFKSVGYQLIYTTLFQKNEYIKFKFDMQDMQISRLQTCFSAINMDNIN